MNKKIMAATSFYNQKYFFDDSFMDLPPNILDEIQILLVELSEKIQGIVQLGFYSDGELFLEVSSGDSDFSFDEIGANLQAKEVYRENREFFNMLENWYSLNFTDEGKAKKDEILDIFEDEIENDDFIYDELRALEDLKDFFEKG